MLIAASVYGDRYVPFLGTFLESAMRVGYEDVAIVHDAIDLETVAAFARAYPTAQLVPTAALHGTVGSHRAIASKVHSWRELAERNSGREGYLALMDIDTVFLKPIEEFCTGEEVIFTWKDEELPINLGVLLLRSNGAVSLLAALADATEEILCNERRFREARVRSGAADQHAFRSLVGWVNYDGSYERVIGSRGVSIRGVRCALLNETRSVRITDETHVVHFKSGWHPRLLDGDDFGPYRSAEDSADMLEVWDDLTAGWRARVGSLPEPEAEPEQPSWLARVRSQVHRHLRP